MSKELLLVIESAANEKSISREAVNEAMEQAVAMATRKMKGIDLEARVEIDPKTGDFKTFRRWTVVNDDVEIENPDAQITLSEALKEDPSIEVGEVLEEEMPSIEFGRIAAQTARNIVMQKIRDAERDKLVEEFQGRVGELILGTVKRVTRDVVIVDLGEHAEAIMPRTETIPREVYKMGDRIRAYLKEAFRDQRGAQIILSRACPEMLMELMRLEVPEVAEDIIEIKKAVRDPGNRAKIAVKSYDSRVDPIGACIGMRGSRIQAVTNELAGERIDVIVYDDNPVQFVMNALAPAEIVSVVMDEENKVMDIAVKEEQLSLAIGRGGQNVRMAGQLTGWRLNVMAENEREGSSKIDLNYQKTLLMQGLDVDDDVAQLLINEGFTSLEEVAYVPAQELVEIGAFDEEVVMELRNRAKNALLARALSNDPKANLNQDLLALEGMTEELAIQLSERGIVTRDDLAEQAVDEIMDLPGMTETFAGKLIMAARAHWFDEEA